MSDLVVVGSKVSGKQLPTWKADLPETLTRTGRRSVTMAVNIFDEDYEPPATVPKKMTVTLYAVDKRGKREKVDTRSDKITKKGQGRVDFKDVVAAGSHHMVEVEFDGGSLSPGGLIYTAAIGGKAKTRVAERTRGHLDTVAGPIAGSTPVAGPRVGLQPHGRPAGPVQRLATFVTDSFDIGGKTAAGKLPEWQADIPSTRVSRGAAARDVIVGLMLVKKNFAPPNPAPNALDVALFDIDKKGKRKKIATQKVAVDAGDAGATVTFSGVKAAKDHYQVELELSGGSAGSGAAALLRRQLGTRRHERRFDPFGILDPERNQGAVVESFAIIRTIEGAGAAGALADRHAGRGSGGLPSVASIGAM